MVGSFFDELHLQHQPQSRAEEGNLMSLNGLNEEVPCREGAVEASVWPRDSALLQQEGWQGVQAGSFTGMMEDRLLDPDDGRENVNERCKTACDAEQALPQGDRGDNQQGQQQQHEEQQQHQRQQQQQQQQQQPQQQQEAGVNAGAVSPEQIDSFEDLWGASLCFCGEAVPSWRLEEAFMSPPLGLDRYEEGDDILSSALPNSNLETAQAASGRHASIIGKDGSSGSPPPTAAAAAKEAAAAAAMEASAAAAASAAAVGPHADAGSMTEDPETKVQACAANSMRLFGSHQEKTHQDEEHEQQQDQLAEQVVPSATKQGDSLHVQRRSMEEVCEAKALSTRSEQDAVQTVDSSEGVRKSQEQRQSEKHQDGKHDRHQEENHPQGYQEQQHQEAGPPLEKSKTNCYRQGQQQRQWQQLQQQQQQEHQQQQQQQQPQQQQQQQQQQAKQTSKDHRVQSVEEPGLKRIKTLVPLQSATSFSSQWKEQQKKEEEEERERRRRRQELEEEVEQQQQQQHLRPAFLEMTTQDIWRHESSLDCGVSDPWSKPPADRRPPKRAYEGILVPSSKRPPPPRFDLFAPPPEHEVMQPLQNGNDRKDIVVLDPGSQQQQGLAGSELGQMLPPSFTRPVGDAPSAAIVVVESQSGSQTTVSEASQCMDRCPEHLSRREAPAVTGAHIPASILVPTSGSMSSWALNTGTMGGENQAGTGNFQTATAARGDCQDAEIPAEGLQGLTASSSDLHREAPHTDEVFTLEYSPGGLKGDFGKDLCQEDSVGGLGSSTLPYFLHAEGEGPWRRSLLKSFTNLDDAVAPPVPHEGYPSSQSAPLDDASIGTLPYERLLDDLNVQQARWGPGISTLPYDGEEMAARSEDPSQPNGRHSAEASDDGTLPWFQGTSGRLSCAAPPYRNSIEYDSEPPTLEHDRCHLGDFGQANSGMENSRCPPPHQISKSAKAAICTPEPRAQRLSGGRYHPHPAFESGGISGKQWSSSSTTTPAIHNSTRSSNSSNNVGPTNANNMRVAEGRAPTLTDAGIAPAAAPGAAATAHTAQIVQSDIGGGMRHRQAQAPANHGGDFSRTIGPLEPSWMSGKSILGHSTSGAMVDLSWCRRPLGAQPLAKDPARQAMLSRAGPSAAARNLPTAVAASAATAAGHRLATQGHQQAMEAPRQPAPGHQGERPGMLVWNLTTPPKQAKSCTLTASLGAVAGDGQVSAHVGNEHLRAAQRLRRNDGRQACTSNTSSYSTRGSREPVRKQKSHASLVVQEVAQESGWMPAPAAKRMKPSSDPAAGLDRKSKTPPSERTGSTASKTVASSKAKSPPFAGPPAAASSGGKARQLTLSEAFLSQSQRSSQG